MTRRSLLRAGLTGCLVAPWWHTLRAFATRPTELLTKSGVTDTEIILGTSAAFSGPSRDWASNSIGEPVRILPTSISKVA